MDVDDLGNDASVGRRGGSLSTSGSFVVKGMVANRAGASLYNEFMPPYVLLRK